MNHIDSNARIAWAQAFETGIRTQACADMEEAGMNVQTSRKNPGGGSHNDHYTPIYSAITRLERSNPTLANVGHWLSLNDTEQANRYHDDVYDTVLTRLIMAMPAWSEWREKRKERAKALIQARMMMDRLNVDGTRSGWTPQEICVFVGEYLGVKIIRNNWYQDGWVAVWEMLGFIIDELENCAMEPIHDAIRKAKQDMRKELKHAA
ncbi:hypothetical protein [Phytohalomonas tamaricis]|uniref:hypothetical protein n=1 Tax=Phytohalomonas tamaricis TaxID=2081032 RepID=UPI000D0BB306|nr:hypothetical protein [Phytohalomonas tamaricis]